MNAGCGGLLIPGAVDGGSDPAGGDAPPGGLMMTPAGAIEGKTAFGGSAGGIAAGGNRDGRA